MKLPLNCEVDYIKDFLTEEEVKELYQLLINKYHLDKAQLIIEAGGKMIETDSFKIIFSTEELIHKKHHIVCLDGKVFPWEGLMSKLKLKVEQHTNHKFDLAMCLYYPNGNYFAPYHSDQQTSGYKTTLPSISLGEVREFCFKENETDKVYSMNLDNGSLLLMRDHCQNRYMHSLPKNNAVKNGRINITFREADFQ